MPQSLRFDQLLTRIYSPSPIYVNFRTHKSWQIAQLGLPTGLPPRLARHCTCHGLSSRSTKISCATRFNSNKRMLMIISGTLAIHNKHAFLGLMDAAYAIASVDHERRCVHPLDQVLGGNGRAQCR
ncbi:hypothetical protein HGRIS_005486 [Hohenbuehelia grisea]|uniref:Uncharacterized protein n=1 Tax=Hohenbuehelia grisea TaxID=104357 RepID=A0ABR3JYR6_9AGAR